MRNDNLLRVHGKDKSPVRLLLLVGNEIKWKGNGHFLLLIFRFCSEKWTPLISFQTVFRFMLKPKTFMSIFILPTLLKINVPKEGLHSNFWFLKEPSSNQFLKEPFFIAQRTF